MTITAEQVKQLRDRTGAGMMECKKALGEAGGDLEKAIDVLRKAGNARMEGRTGRAANEGLVEAYIHPGNRTGVLIEVNCETDFVARTPEFAELTRNLAMQVAALGAEFVKREDIPAERIERERAIYAGQVEGQGKPAAIIEKIVEGKLEKFYAEVCLLDQPYIRDDKLKAGDLVLEAARKTGENVSVRRFTRFRLGQGVTRVARRWQRVLLKLSGELLAGGGGHGIDETVMATLADEIRDVHRLGVQIGIVTGGGNIFRGLAASTRGMDRVGADTMGMLATVINGLALQHALEKRGVHTRVMSAIEMDRVCEPYIRRRAVRHLEKERVVVLVAGTGNPYFTTDTAAVLRAVEIGADAVLKATKVDGIYSRDPVTHPDASFYPHITYQEILDRGLAIMDLTAITLLKENRLPLVVFNVGQRGNLLKLVQGETLGTSVTE